MQLEIYITSFNYSVSQSFNAPCSVSKSAEQAIWHTSQQESIMFLLKLLESLGADHSDQVLLERNI